MKNADQPENVVFQRDYVQLEERRRMHRMPTAENQGSTKTRNIQMHVAVVKKFRVRLSTLYKVYLQSDRCALT